MDDPKQAAARIGPEPAPFGPPVAVVAPALAGVATELDEALAIAHPERRVVVARDLEAAERLAAEAAASGERFVVAVGDDTVVHAVLNGLLAEPGDPVVLGVVGAGSPNDLLLTFGLPGDIAGGVRHLAGDGVYELDVMQVGSTDPAGQRRSRYAANLAQVGLGARRARRVERLPALLGPNARRFLGFWSAYPGRTPAVSVDADRGHFEARAWDVVIGNGQFTGGLRLSPRSFPGDGVLEALVFTGPRSQAYAMLPRLFRNGDHIPDPDIKELHARIRVAVDADRPTPVVADGRLLGTTPATFQVVRGRVLLKL